MQIEADALFFDHDGLLVETEWLFYSVTRELFLDAGVVLDEARWSRDYLGKGRGSSAIGVDLGLDAVRLEPLLEERNRRYYALLEQQPPLCDHVREVLEDLGGRFPLALVTGNNRRAIEIVQRSTGLLQHFDLMVTHEDFKRSKPFPDAYLCATGRLGVEPSRCVAVEDSERGLQSALAAGLRCIAVPGVLTRTQTFPGALLVEPTLERLPGLLRRYA